MHQKSEINVHYVKVSYKQLHHNTLLCHWSRSWRESYFVKGRKFCSCRASIDHIVVYDEQQNNFKRHQTTTNDSEKTLGSLRSPNVGTVCYSRIHPIPEFVSNFMISISTWAQVTKWSTYAKRYYVARSTEGDRMGTLKQKECIHIYVKQYNDNGCGHLFWHESSSTIRYMKSYKTQGNELGIVVPSTPRAARYSSNQVIKVIHKVNCRENPLYSRVRN
jgi:hypothetical protein